MATRSLISFLSQAMPQGHSSSAAVKHGCIAPVPEDQPCCPIPGGGVERPRALHILHGGTEGFAPLWRNQGCCWQKEELVLWTCSTNQANPPRVTARRLTGAQLWEGRQRDRRGSFVGFGKRQPLHSPLWSCRLLHCFLPLSLQQVARHKPPRHSGPSHPLPTAHHHLLTTTQHSPAPVPCPLWLHSPLCHFIPSVITPPPLAPRSLLLACKGDRWEGKGFPSSVQKCSSVSKDKACPLCNPPAAAATKAGRGGGPGAWGALCDPKGKTLRKEQNKYPLLPPLLNKRGQN